MMRPRRAPLAWLCALLCALGAAADPSPAFLVKDIGTSAANTFFISDNFRDVDGTVWLSPQRSTIGTELWTTDGTLAGTRLVKDLRPGVQSSAPTVYAKVGDLFYFTADSSGLGRELWTTDGTAAGTTRVGDIFPVSGGETVIVNGTIYFAANDGVHGTELWKRKVDEVEAVLVKDALPGPGDGIIGIARLRNVNGTIYFRARHPDMEERYHRALMERLDQLQHAVAALRSGA